MEFLAHRCVVIAASGDRPERACKMCVKCNEISEDIIKPCIHRPKVNEFSIWREEVIKWGVSNTHINKFLPTRFQFLYCVLAVNGLLIDS